MTIWIAKEKKPYTRGGVVSDRFPHALYAMCSGRERHLLTPDEKVNFLLVIGDDVVDAYCPIDNAKLYSIRDEQEKEMYDLKPL